MACEQANFRKIKIQNGQLRAIYRPKLAQLQYYVNFHHEVVVISTFSKITFEPTFKGASTGAITFMLQLKQLRAVF